MKYQCLVFFWSSFLLFNINYGMRIREATNEKLPTALQESQISDNNNNETKETEAPEIEEKEDVVEETPKKKKEQDDFGLNLAVMKYTFRFVTKVFQHSFGVVTEKVGDLLSDGVNLLGKLLPALPNLLGLAG